MRKKLPVIVFIFIIFSFFYFSTPEQVKGQMCSGIRDGGTKYGCAWSSYYEQYSCPGTPVISYCYGAVSPPGLCVYDYIYNSYCIIDGEQCQGSGCQGQSCSDGYSSRQEICDSPPAPTPTLAPGAPTPTPGGGGSCGCSSPNTIWCGVGQDCAASGCQGCDREACCGWPDSGNDTCCCCPPPGPQYFPLLVYVFEDTNENGKWDNGEQGINLGSGDSRVEGARLKWTCLNGCDSEADYGDFSENEYIIGDLYRGSVSGSGECIYEEYSACVDERDGVVGWCYMDCYGGWYSCVPATLESNSFGSSFNECALINERWCGATDCNNCTQFVGGFSSWYRDPANPPAYQYGFVGKYWHVTPSYGTHRYSLDMSANPNGYMTTTSPITQTFIDPAGDGIARHLLAFGVKGSLPCTSNLNYTCSVDGMRVDLSWDEITGVDSYLVNVNQDPYNDWPATPQDFAVMPSSNSTTVNIQCGNTYGWNVQGIEPGETYPFSGCVYPENFSTEEFMCPCAVLMRSVDTDSNLVEVPGFSRGCWSSSSGTYNYSYSCSSYISTILYNNDYCGAGIALDSHQWLIGVTPAPVAERYRTSGGRLYYYAGDTPWTGELRRYTFVVDETSCELEIPDVNIGVGDTRLFEAHLDINSNPSDPVFLGQIDYLVDDGTVASICDSGPCSTDSYTDYSDEYFRITGNSQNSTTYTATAYLDDGITECISNTANINVQHNPWWQVGFGDIFTGGLVSNSDIESDIPESCASDPLCIDKLISGTSNIPAEGSVLYTGYSSFTPATVSDAGLIADLDGVGLDVSDYTYDYFTKRIEGFSGMTESLDNILNQSDLLSAGNGNPVNSGGNTYKVIIRNGNTYIANSATADSYLCEYCSPPSTFSFPTLSDCNLGCEALAFLAGCSGTESCTFVPGSSADINIGSEKIILFVNGNLTIDNRINLNKGQGFFMAIVNGDIMVNPAVGNAYDPTNNDDTDPELEGIYFTTYVAGNAHDIYTGSTGINPDTTLEIRGIFAAAGGGVHLQRNLLDNSTLPAEKFYYAVDQTFLIPQFFGQTVYRWKEVAP